MNLFLSSRQVLLNIIKGCNWVWFGSIANSVSKEFGFSLRQVNMLGNVPHISYLLFSWCVPILVRRWGLRWSVSGNSLTMPCKSCLTATHIQSVFGSVVMVLSAWLRYAGTARGLSTDGAYALMIIAQVRAFPPLLPKKTH